MGWQMSRQKFKWLVPYHPGAIRYFKTLGVWTEAAQEHQQRLLERQRVLAQAWNDLIAERAELVEEEERWSKAWLTQRANYLDAAGFDPIWRAP